MRRKKNMQKFEHQNSKLIMKRFLTNLGLVLIACVLAQSVSAQVVVGPDTEVSTDKRAQTGLKFLSTSLDARASGMGSALTAELNGSAMSLFYNPGSMAGMENQISVGLGVTQFIADINYSAGAVAYRPSGGNYGVFGISFTSVNYGDFVGTVRSENEAGYVKSGDYSPTALAIGFGYARSFTDRFSIGAQIKYAAQDLGSFAVDVGTNEEFSVNTLAYDFGVVYDTGWKSLVIGVTARNFSSELSYVRENFELPLALQFGAQFNVLDLTSMDTEMHALTVHADLQRPRDFAEHFRFGAEYSFSNLLALRAGFEQLGVSEEQGASFGGGVNLDVGGANIRADYAMTLFGVFGNLNRISFQIGL